MTVRGSSWVTKARDDLPQASASMTLTVLHETLDTLLAICSSPGISSGQVENCIRSYMQLSRVVGDIEDSIESAKVKLLACKVRLFDTD